MTEGLKMKYFVLNPEGITPYHKASRCALREYAYRIMNTNPELATDITNWVITLDQLAAATEFAEGEARKEPDVHMRLRKLAALEAAGVDNWSGYDDAMDEFDDDD